jgi:Leucine-rich repeat (LRR) protein
MRWIGSRTPQDLIETARRDGASSLNLNGCVLDSLPQSLRSLTTLTRLDVNGSRLTVLPDWLGGLTGLTSLGLSRNRLTTLPDWLGNLTGLTELFVGGNQLSGLPESLGNLTALRRLDLSGNRLTVLPDWLGGLTGLTRLDLIGNPLTIVPDWLGNPTVREHPPGAALHAWTGDAPVTVTGAADLDAILDRTPGGVTLTSEDGARRLHITLDGDRSNLVWEGDDEFLVSWGPVPPGVPPGQIAGDAADAFDDPWFAAAVEDSFGDITQDDARQAGHEFLRTGRRPANILWVDKPRPGIVFGVPNNATGFACAADHSAASSSRASDTGLGQGRRYGVRWPRSHRLSVLRLSNNFISKPALVR